MSRPNYLLDVNVCTALSFENHTHHHLVTAWFNTPGRQWSLCSFTEAGFLRNATAQRSGQLTMAEATVVLDNLAQHPGYHYVPIHSDWKTLCSPFSSRLYGTKQVTDAFLLGLAVQNHLVLVTMDKALVHLAGVDYHENVLLLKER